MDLFNKVHVFQPKKSQIYEPNIGINSQINLMMNHAKPRFLQIELKELQTPQKLLSVSILNYKNCNSCLLPQLTL